MKLVKVNVPNHAYDIVIGQNLLARCDDAIKKISNAQKIMIVTDENVAPLYGDVVKTALSNIAQVKMVVLPAGETTKSLTYLSQLYDEAFSFGITRTDLLVALGGGVIGDLTGFCASTLLRGVSLVQIPTTLLSQVDSSVGGKTAIDVPQGKNLVGTFYQPKLVLIDTDTLNTLPEKEFAGGMAEVIKYGAIWNKSLFFALKAAKNRMGIMANIDELIYTCCDIKRQVVEVDEHDTGLRMILNFGHTPGHIIEKAYDYTGYIHGEAVGFGMVIAARMGEQLGITPKGTAEELTEVIAQFGLPTDIRVEETRFMDAALDKKAAGSAISVILLDEIGKCHGEKMEVTDFANLCKQVWGQ